MTCELWVRGIQADNATAIGGTYVDIFVAFLAPTAILPTPNRLNPNLPRNFDQYTGGLPKFWSTSTPPITYLKGTCNNLPIPNLNAKNAHDCVNGQCLPRDVYKTPGVYADLATCQGGCAKNSNCKGECISLEELAALQQAANNLKSRLCK
jgi:hypothetical protein